MTKHRQHFLPPGLSGTEVAERMISEIGQEVERAGGIIIVILGEGDSGSAVAVLPAEEKQRLAEQDPRFNGKLVAIISPDDALKLGIVQPSELPGASASHGNPLAAKRLVAEQRKAARKQRLKDLRRRNRGEQ